MRPHYLESQPITLLSLSAISVVWEIEDRKLTSFNFKCNRQNYNFPLRCHLKQTKKNPWAFYGLSRRLSCAHLTAPPGCVPGNRRRHLPFITLHHPKNAVQVKQATVPGQPRCGHVTSRGRSLSEHCSLKADLRVDTQDYHLVPRPLWGSRVMLDFEQKVGG